MTAAPYKRRFILRPAESPLEAWLWLCSMWFLPQASGWWSLRCGGSPGWSHSFPCVLPSLLPLSSHCSRYSVTNLRKGSENILKSYLRHWLSMRLCSYESHLFNFRESVEHVLFQAHRNGEYCKHVPVTQLSLILVFYHIHFRTGEKEIVLDNVL